MSLTHLEDLLADESTARRTLRKEEVVAALTGTFEPGRTPYIHVAKLGSTEVRLKFVNTIKNILNTKGQPVIGKESYLCYVEVSIFPPGKKPFFYTQDVTQTVWGTSKSKATVKHAEKIAEITEFAKTLGIDLTAPEAWCTTYSMNY